jgi:hypothetical protein
LLKKGFTLSAAAALALPVLCTIPAYASTPEQQLVAISKAANSAPYVQSKMTETEKLSYAGQSVQVQVSMNMQLQHVGKAMDAMATVVVKAPGSNMVQKVYIHGGREYLNQGSSWQYVGAINLTNVQQLTQMSNMVYKSVKEKSSGRATVFTAKLDPKMFSSLIQQALSTVTPSAGSTKMSKSETQVVANVFQNTSVGVVATANKVAGAERLTKEQVTMSLTISPKQIAALGGASSTSTSKGSSTSTTVTKSVYGTGSGGSTGTTGTGSTGTGTTTSKLPKTPLKVSAVETATFTYNHIRVVGPKNLPKA